MTVPDGDTRPPDRRSAKRWYLQVARTITIASVLAGAGATAAEAQTRIVGAARSADGLWQPATDQTVPAAQRRTGLPGGYAVVQLDGAALNARLAQAPDENAAARGVQPRVIITLPLPDGRFSRFAIEESPLLAPSLAARFPDIRTYRGAGVDDRTATARLDLTARGFHAMIVAAGGTVFVDPYSADDRLNHVSYDKASRQPSDRGFEDVVVGSTDAQRLYNSLPITNGTVLRTYRLAVAATAEYTAAAGGSSAAMSRITTTLNRVDGIYERELAVRMSLVNALIYTDSGTQPYSNANGFAMLDQNQANLDASIGPANYDIGHVFSTGGGGVAALSSVCSASSKARGVTGSSNPVGDGFDVDYVAHEMGHQFGANHTFNGTTSSCGGGNRSPSHAYEVGSGSTIQAYAGICGGENLQRHSDDIFNFESLNEMTAFITSGGGSSCGSTGATGNLLPVITLAGTSFTIPRLTPFSLSAAATDANGDTLTYLWEEHDLGTASVAGTAGTDDGSRPLFRSYAPSTSSTRTFPSFGYVLHNSNTPPPTYSCSGTCLTGEVLPSTSRTMTFMLTVRDSRNGGGGVTTAQTQVTVNSGIGPFAVSSPNAAVSWVGGTTQTVTWSPNGSAALAATVRILLSTNGGATFPTVLLASTANDGSATITLPNTPTATARVMIEALGNIFFDVSDANFTIVASSPPPAAFAKTAPATGASGVSTGPTLTWGSSTGATSYEYCVDTSANATCDTGWVNGGPATSGALSGLQPGTTYTWQVRALNASGATAANAGTWWTFATAAAPAWSDDVAIDFGVYGLWGFYDGGTAPAWRQLHGGSPSAMTRADLDGNGRADLVLVFPGHGTWALMNDVAYVQLHYLDAGLLEAGDLDGNGRDEVVLTFPGIGTWIRYDDASWRLLHVLAASTLVVGNVNGTAGGRADVVLSFTGPAGLWIYSNNTDWGLLHPVSATHLEMGDVDGNGVGDMVVQFSLNYGEYILFNGSTWSFLSGTVATGFVLGNIDGDAGGRSDVVINLPGQGLMAFVNGSGWIQIHPLTAAVMAAGDIDGSGAADLILSFTGYGLWTRRNGSVWTQIHSINPEGLVAGPLNGN